MITPKISFITLASVFALSSSFAFADQATQAKLAAEAKISEADARTAALAKVPGGTVSSSELEQEHGKLIWSFDIAKVGSKHITEVQVDAKTGMIVSTQVETPDKQRKEAIADKKEGKAY
jgi:Peptidase propeptide and YPEB domain